MIYEIASKQRKNVDNLKVTFPNHSTYFGIFKNNSFVSITARCKLGTRKKQVTTANWAFILNIRRRHINKKKIKRQVSTISWRGSRTYNNWTGIYVGEVFVYQWAIVFVFSEYCVTSAEYFKGISTSKNWLNIFLRRNLWNLRKNWNWYLLLLFCHF